MHGTVCIGDAINWGSPLNRGLVSWWLALPDQQRGNVFRDLCMRNHGTLTNGPTWHGAGGRLGGRGSVLTDGATNAVITSSSPAIELAVPFSVLWWQRDNSSASGGVMISQTNAGASAGWYTQRATNSLYVNIPGVGDASSASTATFDGRWHFVGFVYTGAHIEWFVNGTLDSQTARTGTPNPVTSGVYLGAYPGGGNKWAGWHDGAMVFNRPLSAGEVSSIAREGVRGYPTTLNWTRPRAYVEQGGGGGTSILRQMLQQGLFCGGAA